MKKITILGLALLSGCAGMPGGTQSPGYDPNLRSVLSPGYPVESVHTPAGFQLASSNAESGRTPRSSASDNGSTNLSQAAYTWTTAGWETAMLTVRYIGVDSGSRLLPLTGSAGHEFSGNQKVVYSHRGGRYKDLAGDQDSIPAAAPDCAYSTELGLTRADATRRVIAIYVEGIACDRLSGLSQQDLQQQRTRARVALGI